MYLKIKDWAKEDRPREKLVGKGPSVLSDAELLAILISTGTRDKSAVDIGRELLKLADNNLNILGKLDLADIRKVAGIGEAKAVIVAAALELGRRRKMASSPESLQIRSSRDAADIFHPLLADLRHEEFWLLFLSRSNKEISRMRLSQGGISGTVIDVRILMKKAVECLASGIILCHNHPSGNISPSDADIQLTRKIRDAGRLMDINLLDHIIICGDKYYSFADNGGF